MTNFRKVKEEKPATGYSLSGLGQYSRRYFLDRCNINNVAKRLSKIFHIRLFRLAVEKIIRAKHSVD